MTQNLLSNYGKLVLCCKGVLNNDMKNESVDCLYMEELLKVLKVVEEYKNQK